MIFSLFIATTYGEAAAPGAPELKAVLSSSSVYGTRIPTARLPRTKNAVRR